MEILFRAKCLYIVTMATEAEPNAAIEKIKWHNKRDEAYGLLCLSISRDLLFHLDGLKLPNEVWENIFDIFGKTYEMRGHQIENELISLSPNSFESLQLYFSKFKALLMQLKNVGSKIRMISWSWSYSQSLALTIQCLFRPSMPPS